jgi:hypothetical protein
MGRISEIQNKSVSLGFGSMRRRLLWSLLGQDVPRFGDTQLQRVAGPGPARRLSGRWAKPGAFLVRQVDRSGDQCPKVRGNCLVLKLQPLRRALALLVMGFVVDPVAKEQGFVRGQFH